ncbi:hypothetical protein Tco_0342054, partial [Tanacetum coccineum]
MARRSRGRITEEEPDHFGDDALSCPPSPQRIAISLCSSNARVALDDSQKVDEDLKVLQMSTDGMHP